MHRSKARALLALAQDLGCEGVLFDYRCGLLSNKE